MTGMLGDFRYALRGAARSPGAFLVGALSLAVGIGLCSAVASLIDGVFLRPLPVESPQRLVWIEHRGAPGETESMAYADFLDIRSQCPALQAAVAQSRRGTRLRQDGLSQPLLLTVVSDGYFQALGIRPALGRLFDPAQDARLAQEPSVIISHRLWRQRFGADPAILGRPILLDDRILTVVGVMNPRFRGTMRTFSNDVWVPTSTWTALHPGNQEELDNRGWRSYEVLGRLAPGQSLESLQAQLDTLARRLQEGFPQTNRERRFEAVEEDRKRRGPALGASALFVPVVATVLLIACANVASLSLAEGISRRREAALRSALGAGRGRIIRQSLSASLLLAAVGTALGIGLAAWLLDLVPSLTPPGPFSLDLDLRIDQRVLAATFLASLFSILLSGLLPALRGSRLDLAPALRGGLRDSAALSHLRGQKLVTVAQMAVCVVLVGSAALLERSFIHSLGLPLGFDKDRELLLASAFFKGQEEGSARTGLLVRIEEELEGSPEVERASFARRMHLSGSGGGAAVKVSFPAQPSQANEDLSIKYNEVASDYFETVGTPILRGRAFNASDRIGSRPVIVISQAMAERFWPGGQALGQSLLAGGQSRQVVGVAADSKINFIHEPAEPYIYFPFAQTPSGEVTLLVEGRQASQLADSLRRTLRPYEARLTLYSLTTLRNLLQAAYYQDRLMASVGAMVGLVGVFLAAVGLYAFMTQTVKRRRREIGIRMALGARRSDILGQVLGRSLSLALIGLPIGIAGAVAVGRLMSSQLYGVSAADPISLLLSALAVLALALLATQSIARRAARSDAAAALRCE